MKSKPAVTAKQSTVTGTRWNEEDLWFLAALKQATGITVLSELQRHLIRLGAKHYGITVPAPKPAKR